MSNAAAFRRHPVAVVLSGFVLVVASAALLAPRVDAQAPADPHALVAPSFFQDLRYRSIGPARGGRVTAVAGHRRQRSTFYLGATGGGVWKTTDYGITWRPVSDGYVETGSIGAIAVAESNPDIVYVGTGSAAIRSNVIVGRGVYKSTDAGRTWSFAGLRDAGQIGALEVHPANPDIAYVAALGSPFGPGETRGVFRTTDGGATWDKVLYVNERTGFVSLAMNPADPREIYAGAWRGERKPWTIISGGPASETGLYKSRDGGDTWTKLEVGLPRTLIGKIAVDVSPADPKCVYVLLEAPGTEGGLYRSDDAGASFTQVSSDARLTSRPFYYIYVNAHPKEVDTVYVNGNVSTFVKSTDGGRTWTVIPTPHGDNHGMWINPDDPDVFIQSNDGGANVTLNGGASWSTQLNQPTAEIYQVDVDDQFPYRVYGAQQDTGAPVILPSLPPMARRYEDPLQLWLTGPGCETGPVKAKPGAPHILFGVCKGEFYRMNLHTGQEQAYWVYPQNRYGHDPDDMYYRFQRVSPFEFSPHDPDVIYHTSHVVHRTRDGGRTWEEISPDLTANEPDKQVISGEPITRDITGEEVYSAIYAIAESPIEPGVIWTGSNDGPVYVTRDHGRHWRNVTPDGLPPGGRVQSLDVSRRRKGSAIVTVYRYLLDDFAPYVYRTDDYGATWTRLADGTNGIPPDSPTRVVREDPDVDGLLYAGTEFGMYVSFDSGRHWQAFQLNLPRTPVTDLRVHRQDLVLSTMGRGFWILDDLTPLHQLARARADGSLATWAAHLFEPRATPRMRYQTMGELPHEPQYPTHGVRVDYYFAQAPQGEVSLEIRDAAGRIVRRVGSGGPGETTSRSQQMGPPAAARTGTPQLATSAGMHRFVWDLRHAVPDGVRAAGPLVPPGRYEIRLTAGDWTATRTVEVVIDPRLPADGVTVADLEEQFRLHMAVLRAMADGRRLVDRVAKLREQARALGPAGEAGVAEADAIAGRLVTAGGPYPQIMLIDQFAAIARMIGQADQAVGRDAYIRYDDLKQDLAALVYDADRLEESLRTPVRR